MYLSIYLSRVKMEGHVYGGQAVLLREAGRAQQASHGEIPRLQVEIDR